MTTTKCTCTGPVCSCGALGVVKDGAGVRVSGLMMDSAPADTTAEEQARNQMIADMGSAHLRQDGAAAVVDRKSIEDDIKAQAIADAKQAGLSDDEARVEAAHAVMVAELSGPLRQRAA